MKRRAVRGAFSGEARRGTRELSPGYDVVGSSLSLLPRPPLFGSHLATIMRQCNTSSSSSAPGSYSSMYATSCAREAASKVVYFAGARISGRRPARVGNPRERAHDYAPVNPENESGIVLLFATTREAFVIT